MDLEPKAGDTRFRYAHNERYMACAMCGKLSWKRLNINGTAKYPLCFSCARKHPQSESSKEKKRISQIKAMNDPIKGRRIKNGLNSRWKNENEKRSAKQSVHMLEWWSNPETKKRMGKIHAETFNNPATKEKHRNSIIKSYDNPELRQQRKNVMIERNSHPEEREKIRQVHINRYKDPNEHKKTSELNKIRWQNPERRKHHSQKMIEKWSDPIYKENTVSATFRALKLSPNIPETIIINVLNTYFPNEWEFVGNNNKFPVDGKRPDFKHNTNNWVIEHFGDYHHTDKNKNIKEHQTYNGRIDFLAKRGYKTLILWEHEVKKRPMLEIAQRISTFFNCPMKQEVG
jgi:very-short-patch-repair endonuclease